MLTQLAAKLEQSVGGSPQPGGEPPKDSIEGAVLNLLHVVIDGMVASVPRMMQASTSVNRATRPVRIELKGRNSQGLASVLTIQVDIDHSLQGLRADVRLVLVNQQNQPVHTPSRSFGARRNESVKTITKQFGEWLGQAEALQMQPVGSTGQPVML